MEYLKTYENFTIGNMSYLILSKDRTKQLGSHTYDRRYTSYFTYQDITKYTDVNSLRRWDSDMEAQKVLDALKEEKINNYYIEDDTRPTGSFGIKGTLYTNSVEFKEIIKKAIGKPMPINHTRVESFYPYSFASLWRSWEKGLTWGRVMSVADSNAMQTSQETIDSYPNQKDKKDFINFLKIHVPSYQQISFQEYLEALDQFEVVPFFIGGTEQVTTEDEFVNL